MPDKMTPERALIVLNQCNTDGRIKVDREELKEAVKVVHDELRYRIPMAPRSNRLTDCYYCPNCVDTVYADVPYCATCGQAIDWSDYE